MVLHAARWVVVLNAVLQATLNIKKPYMITRKGVDTQHLPAIKTYIPYTLLILLSLGTALWYIVTSRIGGTRGYLFFAIQEASFFVLLMLTPYLLALKQKDSVGCIGVVVDAKKNAVDFYDKLGFKIIDHHIDGEIRGNPPPQPMFLPIKSIAIPTEQKTS